MARKPCAQNVVQLEEICDISCNKFGAKRYNRIARNAILPFYYDCSKCNKFANPSELNSQGCVKIFYIKNPAFFSANNENTVQYVTQKAFYSYLANLTTRTTHGKRKSQKLNITTNCNNTATLNNFFEAFIPPTITKIKSYETIDKNHFFSTSIYSDFNKCNCYNNGKFLKN